MRVNQFSRLFLAALTPIMMPAMASQPFLPSLERISQETLGVSTEVPSTTEAGNQPQAFASDGYLSNIEQPAISNLRSNYASSARTTSSNGTCASSYGYIKIQGKTRCITQMSLDSAGQFITPASTVGWVAKYGNLLYGHNTSPVFGLLSQTRAGDTFEVKLGNSVKTYRVASNEVFCYSYDARSGCSDNGLVKKWNSIIKKTGGHDLYLQTCAGTSYGSGNASHRRYISAYAI